MQVYASSGTTSKILHQAGAPRRASPEESAAVAAMKLEIQLEAELDNARIVTGSQLAEPGRVREIVERKVRNMVERVKEFASELHTKSLADLDVLHCGDVPVV